MEQPAGHSHVAVCSQSSWSSSHSQFHPMPVGGGEVITCGGAGIGGSALATPVSTVKPDNAIDTAAAAMQLVTFIATSERSTLSGIQQQETRMATCSQAVGFRL